jgi:hypothetical protein
VIDCVARAPDSNVESGVPRGDATAFVTAVLQNVDRDVTRMSSSCYAMFLEYSYRVMEPRG